MVSWLSLLLLAMPATQSTQPASADLATVRQRYIQSVIPTDPAGQAEVRRSADKAASTINDNGSCPDIDYSDQARSAWLPRQHLERAALMARAYSFSRDRTLLLKTQSALDYWLAHDYRNPNWWHNEIGTPLLIGEIDALLGP